MNTLRRFRETHRADATLLLRLDEYIREHGLPEDAAVSELSGQLGFPEAALRGVISYYEELRDAASGEYLYCRGTSCMLAGADTLHADLASDEKAKPVYCLGYCDRSPAVLVEPGAVLFGQTAREPAKGKNRPESMGNPACDVRCLAPEPIVTRRLLHGNASKLEDARRLGVYRALAKALRGKPEEVLSAVEQSGHRGRGGAGFPTGLKWQRGAQASGPERYVVANGDEGDPGSFIDRLLMEHDPHGVLEGLLLCGFAVGAQQGIIFIRSEYPRAQQVMQDAVAEARAAGILGPRVLGSAFSFEVSIFPGKGSYVCGEETAMLNAIEGFRGEVRLRPPYPPDSGLFGKPTIVNNVETLVDIPVILDRGAQRYQALGTEASSGTKAMCLNHGFARPGVVEVEFGMTLRELIEEAGGGADGKRLEAVLLGGPMGNVLLPEEWNVPICYSAMAERGIQLGHGGLVAVPQGTDYRALLDHWLRFMMDESCGKCVPCRLGSKRAWNVLRHDADGSSRAKLERLFDVMQQGSLCAFGQFMPVPMRQLLQHFGDRIFNGGGKS